MALSGHRIAFVDIETTGGNPARDRITEIGIVRMADDEIMDEWSSLVDPGQPIPREIQALTGITDEMVRDAPPFAALGAAIAERLAGWTFAAHNARFDYGFLKAEFRRLGERFLADVLCTVRLSRRLHPGEARHGLDAVIERHGLDPANRHRALGDARLIARFYALMRASRSRAEVDAAVEHLLKRPALPPQVPEEHLLSLPDEPGVYVFRGVNDLPIYVGKASNLRERVFAHFYADSRSGNDARLTAEVRRVSYEETPGEFSALLREIEWIRKTSPLHNIALRRRETAGFVALVDPPADPVGQEGAATATAATAAAADRASGGAPSTGLMRPAWRYVPLAGFDPRRPAGLHGPFSSRQRAREALAAIGREHRLCDFALGSSQGNRACFSFQVGRCLGLCCGRESARDHHRRLAAALAPLAFTAWPFRGPIEFVDEAPARRLVSRWQFDQWCLIDADHRDRRPFDLDIYRLLKRTLARRPEAFSEAPLASAVEPAPSSPRQP